MSKLSIKANPVDVGEKLMLLADWLDETIQHNYTSTEVQEDLRRWSTELGYDPDRLPDGDPTLLNSLFGGKEANEERNNLDT